MELIIDYVAINKAWEFISHMLGYDSCQHEITIKEIFNAKNGGKD